MSLRISTYGELLVGTKKQIRFLYNGSYGVATDENGLYYMRARYYNPNIKRFINQDIKVGDIGSSQSLNRYAYCEGNPVSQMDPFGLSPQSGNEKSWLETLHTFLDIAGIAVDAADLVNAAIYCIEGKWGEAALSAISLIPAAGSFIAGVAKGSKAFVKAKKAEKVVELVAESGKTYKSASNAVDITSDTMKAVSKWGDNPFKLVDNVTSETASKAMKAMESGGDFAKESKKAVWEMKAVSGGEDNSP